MNRPISSSHRSRILYSIQGDVSFALPRAEPARPCPYTRLAITPSRHPGPCLHLSPRAIRTDVSVVTNLTNLNCKTLPTVRTNQKLSRPHSYPRPPFSPTSYPTFDLWSPTIRTSRKGAAPGTPLIFRFSAVSLHFSLTFGIALSRDYHAYKPPLIGSHYVLN